MANPYDTCVMDKTIHDAQCTILFHVDDLKISHPNPKVIDGIVKMLKSIFGDISAARGKQHSYLGVDVDF